MGSEETPPINNTEVNPAINNEGPWQKMAKESQPFGNNEKQSTDMPETAKDEVESDDYYTFEGVEYINVNKIDISTEQGKYKWLYSILENARVRLEDEQYNIIDEEGLHRMDEKEQEKYLEDDDKYQDNKRVLDLVKRQKMIVESLNIDGDGGTLDALEQKMYSFSEAANNPKASEESRDIAFQNWDAAQNLHGILSMEMASRDPKYSGQEEMNTTLKTAVAQAEQRVEQTMADGYFGEDGFIHEAPNGEKIPTLATEDAEIDLKYAKQDVETFNLLMDDYQAKLEYIVPHAIKKEDFAPTINDFINNHTTQINQLLAESRALTKGTPEYAQNKAKRKKLASERSAAKRLATRYFNVPIAEPKPSSNPEPHSDESMNMEQMPTGKTKEQIEAEESKKQQEHEFEDKQEEEMSM